MNRTINSMIIWAGATALIPSMALAQQADPNEEATKNRVRISIDQEIDGSTIKIDTAFTLEQNANLSEILKSLGLENVVEFNDLGDDVEIIINKREGIQDELNGLKLEFNELIPDLRDLQSMMRNLQDQIMVFSTEASEGRAMLGIYYDHEEINGQWGAHISQIVEGSGAEKAGLQVGDVILGIDGKSFTADEQIRRALVPYSIGDEVELRILRGESELEVTAQLGSSQEDNEFQWQNGDDAYEFHWDGSDFDFKNQPFFADPGSLNLMEEKPFLGVYLDYSSEEGVRISGTVSGSTAEAMGLQEGDIITRINNLDVSDIESLKAAIAEQAIGDNISVQYLRGKKTMKASEPLQGTSAPLQGAMFLKHGLQGAVGNLEEMIQKQLIPQGGVISEDLLKDLEQLRSLEDLNIFFSEEPFDFGQNGKALDDRIIRRVAVFITMDNITDAELAKLNEYAEPKISSSNNLPVEGLYFSPNPNDGQFILHFELVETGPAIVQLYDISGRVVYSQEFSGEAGPYTEQIDVTEEPKGVYFLSVIQNGKNFSKKVVVQ